MSQLGGTLPPLSCGPGLLMPSIGGGGARSTLLKSFPEAGGSTLFTMRSQPRNHYKTRLSPFT